MSLQIPLAPLAARVGGDVGELPEAAEAGVGVQGSFDCSAQDDKMYADTIYFLAVFFEPRRDSWTEALHISLANNAAPAVGAALVLVT